MSKYQVHVHWREPVDGESSTVFRKCALVEAHISLCVFQCSKQVHTVNIAATQLITVTPEKETA